MAQLTFYCPYTNQPIPSEIEIEPQNARKVGAFPIDLYCPYCKSFHHGVIADGTVSPTPETTA